MRREILYPTDIVESADHVEAFILGMDFRRILEFGDDPKRRSAEVDNHRRSRGPGFSSYKKSSASGSLAADRRLPEYSCSCLFRDRLGAGGAGGEASLSGVARTDRSAFGRYD